MLLGGAAAVASFTPSLMPRPTLDQSVITGGSMLAGFAVGSTAYGAATGLGRGVASLGVPPSVARFAGPAALAAAGAIALAAAAPREDESLRRATVRTIGTATVLGAGAAASVMASSAARAAIAARVPKGGIIGPALVGAAVLGGGAAMLASTQDKARRAHGDTSGLAGALRPLAIGLGVATAAGGLIALKNAGAGAIARPLASRLPGSPAAWRFAGNAAILGAVGGLGWFGIKQVAASLDRANHEVEPAYAAPATLPTVSTGPGSPLEPADLGRQGRRFIAEVTPASKIREVTGQEAIDPVRVYVGTPAAGTIAERVSLAMAELERTGAFERSTLLFASPSGTGFVNPIPVAAAEYMARGDIATVAMQYGARPSVMSADRVGTGAEQNAALLEAIGDRLEQIPAERRPRLVMYGESLGAHTTQDVFLHRGTDGVREAGVDRALWTGSPYRSKWRQQVLARPRPDVDPRELAEFNSIADVRALPAGDRDRLRVMLLTHDDDPVSKFGIDTLVQRPRWLDGDRPATVPDDMTWIPGVTFLQLLFDAKNAATVVPGRFESRGHDYRADLAPFVREAYRFDHVDDAELGRIEETLVADELERARQLSA